MFTLRNKADFITGNGYAQLYELAASANMYCMSENTFSKYKSKITNNIHEAVLASMQQAGREEVEYAVQNGNIDEKGRPWCAVITDGQWGTRSYGLKYTSKSGWVRTKLVIYIKILKKTLIKVYSIFFLLP